LKDMRASVLVIIVGTTLLSPVIVGYRIKSDKLDTDTTAEGVGLHAKCQAPPPPPCVGGSVRKISKWGRGDYCECANGKVMVVMSKSGKELLTPADRLAARTNNLDKNAKCAAKSHNENWFWTRDSKLNSGCTCPGFVGKYCLKETTVKMHMSGGEQSSPLTCSAGQCKVSDSNHCNVLHQFKAKGPSDCGSGKTCGVISQRCVSTLTSARLEQNLFTTLKNSMSEASTYTNSARIMQVVSEMSVSSKDAEITGLSDWKGDKSFHPVAWEKNLVKRCKESGLTEQCTLR
jgi:hypothetical protein